MKYFHPKRAVLLALISITIHPLFFGQSRAGEAKQMVVPPEIAAPVVSHDWSVEVGTGVQFSNVRRSELDGYTQVPVDLTAAYKIDDVSLDNVAWGIFRGYTDFVFQGFYVDNAHNPGGEHHIFGLNAGPRYNFVQPGWKVVPYVQGLVGACFADSNPHYDSSGNAHGLGEDFNFTFGVGTGIRYDIDDQWFLRLGLQYTHYSNAGLSGGTPNRAIDALGPLLSVGYSF